MSDSDPFAAIRAMLFVVPLATLVGSVLGPPDPFTQLALVAMAVVLGWPLARRVEREYAIDARTLGGFSLVVGIVALGGLWLTSTTGVAGLLAWVARVAVVALAIGVAVRLVLVGPRR